MHRWYHVCIHGEIDREHMPWKHLDHETNAGIGRLSAGVRARVSGAKTRGIFWSRSWYQETRCVTEAEAVAGEGRGGL